MDHAAFPAHVHVEHLKPETLGLPADSFLLHLSQSQHGHPTAMILVAETRYERPSWYRMVFMSDTNVKFLFFLICRSDKEMWVTALSNMVKET